MLRVIGPRDLAPIPAVAVTAFLVLAVFAWVERTVVVDPEGMSVSYWPWKVWQIGALLMALVGVWWVWSSTRRVPWVRSLALGLLALVVLLNGYGGLFGDYWGEVWRTVNPLFIGSASVAAVTLWRCGCPAGRGGRGGVGGVGGAGVRQCLLRKQWGCVADTGPGANAGGAGLGRGGEPGECRRKRARAFVLREIEGRTGEMGWPIVAFDGFRSNGGGGMAVLSLQRA